MSLATAVDQLYHTLNARLLRLNLESLESRRVKADLVLLFKIIHGFVDIEYSAMFDIQFDRTTRGHDLRIRKCHSNVDARKFHFRNRVIDAWNNQSSLVSSGSSEVCQSF